MMIHVTGFQRHRFVGSNCKHQNRQTKKFYGDHVDFLTFFFFFEKRA